MSAWGSSWAYAWGDSWGATQVIAPGRFPRNGSIATFRPVVQAQARVADPIAERLQETYSRAETQADMRPVLDAQQRPITQGDERHEPEANNRTKH